MIRSVVGAAAILSAVAPVRAQPPAGVPNPAPTTTTATAESPGGSQQGIAIGAELGEPTAVTVGWWKGALGVSAALGTGTRAGLGLSFHADVQVVVARLTPHMPLRIGLGGRYYHHGYESMSFDEIPDSHYGIRASAAVAYERGAVQLYAEVAPGVDVVRTASCTLASGPYSICPHAQDRPLFVQLVIGARWFLSR